MNNILAGAMRGTLYGALGGLVLGAAGHAFGGRIDFAKEMVFRDRGKRQQFVYLDEASHLEVAEDLYALYKFRSHHKEPVDELCRNVQSILILYHRVRETESSDAGTVASATGHAIRAGQACRALKELVSATDAIGADVVQKSGMQLQLSLEEIVNELRVVANRSVG